MAFMYLEGLGVEKDEAKAFRLFKNAASAGNINAQYQTGVCYETGCGCTANLDKAREWYEKAASSGDSYAMDRLGIIYYNGSKDLKKDPEKSFEWFLKAASDGMVDSMYSVGCYYLEGFGVERDETEARKWLNMAKDNGHKTAEELLESLGRQ